MEFRQHHSQGEASRFVSRWSTIWLTKLWGSGGPKYRSREVRMRTLRPPRANTSVSSNCQCA